MLYAQKTANRHMNSGPFLGTILYIISVVLFLFGLIELVRKRDNKFFALLLFFSTSLAFWGYKLHSLICLRCLNSS